MDNKVSISKVINGPIDEVFDAFVNPEIMDQWHHPDGYTSKNEVEGEKSYKIHMKKDGDSQAGIISGKYLTFDRPNKLVFTWAWNWQKDLPPTTVEVDFKKLDENKTEVSLVHIGFADEITAKQHAQGWEMALNNLNNFLAK